METIRYSKIGREDVAFGDTSFNVRLADGRVVTLHGVTLDDVPVLATLFANLPAVGSGGRLRRVTDDVMGLWLELDEVWMPVNGHGTLLPLKASGLTADRTRNTEILQNALDQAPAGATLLLPPAPAGREIYHGQVTGTKAVTLQGMGMDGTNLVADATTTFGLKFEANRVRLIDFTLDGAVNATPGVYGIWFNGYSHHWLERVQVKRFVGTASSDATRGCGLVIQATANGGFFCASRGCVYTANGHGVKTIEHTGPPEIPVTYHAFVDTVVTSNLKYGLFDETGFTYGLYIRSGQYAFNGAEAWMIRPRQFAIINPNLEDNGGATYQGVFTSPGDETVFEGLVVGLALSSLSFYPGTWASGGYYAINGVFMSTPESPTSLEPALRLQGNLDLTGEKYYVPNEAGFCYVDGGVVKNLIRRANTRQAVVGDTDATGGNPTILLQAPNDHTLEVLSDQVRVRGDAATHEITVTSTGVTVKSGTNTVVVNSNGTEITGNAGFYGTTPVAQQTVAGVASDPGTTQTLANSLRTILINLGLAAA